jgi:NADPH:quinone reductase-like Zn-dependent oxidoreductase
MRAWTQSRTGAPREALALSPSVPKPPSPTGSNLLIQITHAGLNPADLQLLSVVPTWLPFRRTPTPGMDFVGTVVEAGPAAPPELKAGTTVCGALGVKQQLVGTGTLAEFISVPAEVVAVKPERLNAAQAVGLGIAGQTAALVMREAGDVQGKKVLVNGASGGVGTILLQILKAKGAVVTAVCSASNEDVVKGLGADEVGSCVSRSVQSASALYTQLHFWFGENISRE